MTEKIFPETINSKIDISSRLKRINYGFIGHPNLNEAMEDIFGVDDIIDLIGMKVVFFVNEKDFYFFNEKSGCVEIDGNEAFIGSVLTIRAWNVSDDVVFSYESRDGDPPKAVPSELNNQAHCLHEIETSFGKITGPLDYDEWSLETFDGKEYNNGEVVFRK